MEQAPPNSGQLTQEDIQALMEHPDAETKVSVINKLSQQYNHEGFSDKQIALAEEIFRLLVRQAEIEVRKALSENLMTNRHIPHDVILSLAKDVEEVSLPVLEFSEVLTDEDLIEIVNTSERAASQIAIANRSHVSEAVSAALIETENEEVVHNLLQNDNAEIADTSMERVVSTFHESERIVDSMLTRGALSSNIIQQLTEKVSLAMQHKLEKKYEQSFEHIHGFFKESSEIAAFRFMGMQVVDQELMALVDDLQVNGQLFDALHPVHGQLTQLLDGLEQLGQLTPLSALTMGHLTLFEISLSRMTGIPFENVHKLVKDEKGGLKALYERADLPKKFYETVKFVVTVIRHMEKEAEEGKGVRAREDHYQYKKRLMNDSEGQNIPNLAHFMSMVEKHIEKKQGEW